MNRRDFLKKSAAIGGGLTLVGKVDSVLADESSEISKSSKDIASYLIKEGKRPFITFTSKPEDYQDFHRISKNLPDGRNLTITYHNVGGRSVDDPSRDSSLKIILAPSKKDQFGYYAQELGLTGDFLYLAIVMGVGRDGLAETFYFDSEVISDVTRRKLEKKYEHLKEETYDILIAE